MSDVTLDTVKQELDLARATLLQINEYITSNPMKLELLDIRRQLQDDIESGEKRLELLSGFTDASRELTDGDRIFATIDAIYHSTNVLHDNTNELSQKTDSLHEKTDGISEKTDALHSKMDDLHSMAISAQGDSLTILDGVSEISNEVSVVGVNMTEATENLRYQIVEMNKLTRKLVLDNASMKEHVTKQADPLYGRLDLIEGQLSGFIAEQSQGFECVEDRIARLGRKVDGLAGIERKIDGLMGLGEKLDSLTGLHEKLDGFAALHKKISGLEARLGERAGDRAETGGYQGSRAHLHHSHPVSIITQANDIRDEQSYIVFRADQPASNSGSGDFGSDIASASSQQDEAMTSSLDYAGWRKRFHREVASQDQEYTVVASGVQMDTLDIPLRENAPGGWAPVAPCHSNAFVDTSYDVGSQDQEDKVENDGWGIPSSRDHPWQASEASCEGDQEENPEFSSSTWAQAPLSLESLQGRSVEHDGTIRDNNDNVIGQLVQGNVYESAEYYYSLDPSGNVLDNYGWPVGKAKIVDPSEQGKAIAEVTGPLPLPPSVLMGLAVEADGSVLNPLTGAVLGHLVENFADVTTDSCHCDEAGNLVDSLGCIKGKFTTVDQEFDFLYAGYRPDFAGVRREMLDENDIDFIMDKTGYGRELVAMTLMNPQSEAAKMLTAMLPPKKASADSENECAW
ncbi:hypothetical protein BLS_003299 [Venturia inaequalis]|uniref:Uncharacterized protein n=1 Tax=Venturia inaequalis TaxID=5025 RepID=A0A8H3URP3_VENIN|nr:hypothetical protein BLS_003299 [Venturia inaequalis]RDI81206.1 hypothetical protein Vi05172_g8736 [Venturia inaequalis]